MTISETHHAYICKYFKFNEVFSEYMCENYSIGQLRRLIQPSALDWLVTLRGIVYNEFGCGLICNNWIDGGTYSFSGFREPTQVNPKSKWYKLTSQHAHGGAFDLRPVFDTVHTADLYYCVKMYQRRLYIAGMRRVESMEHAPTWLHGDGAQDVDNVQGQIKIFNI